MAEQTRRSLDPYLLRASGYDFANLWMNMTKLVIALLFLYQNALDTQLGVRLFEDYFYVFHVEVESNPEESGGRVNVVTPEDPYFSIDFKPLALGQPYQDFTVEVLELTDSKGVNLLEAPPTGDRPCDPEHPGCIHFKWNDLTGGDKATLRQATFNLLDLAPEESALASGDYHVLFAFKFFRDGRLLGRRGRLRTYRGVLKFLRGEQLRFGDVPVVQGRSFPIPRLILDRLNDGGRWGGWDAHRELRILEEASEGGWKTGSILEADLERGWLQPIRRLAPARTYEQRGHLFDQNNIEVDFTIGFSLLRNEPPRSTYLGPGESDVHFVRIFYEWYFFQEEQGYYYYNLSRHIIDPDGTTGSIGGRPDVRVREFVGLQPESLPYRLQRDRLTGDWHLRVNGNIEDTLPRGSSQELSVVARDDFQSQRIDIRIER